MQEKIIYLSEFEDDDLVDIQGKFYKVLKLKQSFESISSSIRHLLGTVSQQYGALDIGLGKYEMLGRSNVFVLHPEFTKDGLNYKFIKLDCPGWQSGLFKLSIKPYLSLNEAETDQKDSTPHYSFTNFSDDDILSFEEDKFCNGKTVKDMFQKTFENDEFYVDCSSTISQYITELKDTKLLFNCGVNLRFLRVATAKWQSATLRVKFLLEAKSDVEGEIQDNIGTSPLDEIRNLNI